MGDPAMLRTIERELHDTGLDPGRVIFEITETAAIANIGRPQFSDQLAQLGCRFALDDFGAGFGSFYYLKHVHFDVLKIDGEFVRDCCTTDPTGSSSNQSWASHAASGRRRSPSTSATPRP